MSNLNPIARSAANTISATTAAVVLRTAFKAGPVANTLTTGMISTATGAYDLVNLITNSSDQTKVSEGVHRGIGSAAQIIGGLMFMSKSEDVGVKAAAATLTVAGSLVKLVDQRVSSSYGKAVAQGSIYGVATATIFQAASYGGMRDFSPRALIICGAIGATAAVIGVAINSADDAQKAAAAKKAPQS